jgi:predicted ATP-grasp superfamily ATP-dependent carboligase
MPVLGVVLVLDDESVVTRRAVAEQLGAFRSLELGDAMAHRWPAVLEAESAEEAEACVDALHAVVGVAGVDIVYADFEDLLTCADARGVSEEF